MRGNLSTEKIWCPSSYRVTFYYGNEFCSGWFFGNVEDPASTARFAKEQLGGSILGGSEETKRDVPRKIDWFILTINDTTDYEVIMGLSFTLGVGIFF